jgi:predicted O-linked N-acetylglucosamine transferase (SPINDLY family)
MAYAPPKLQQANAVRWSRRLYPAPAPWRKDIVLPADKRGDGKLRVGYISSDFQRHATLALITEMFAHHDRERFEIYAYSYGVDDGGPERVRLRGLVDHFCDLYNINDERACDRIRADKIDVLIDLKGFTQNHRLGLLTRRPAPVQMHYLGFPGTTGSEFVDYFIADSIAAPPGLDRYFTEKLIRLPHAYQINDRTRALPEENGPTRADYGLPEKAFVFCGFNNLYKITPEMFDVWVRLLKSVEASVLWVLETHDESTANLRREAQARGIAPERIIPAKMAPQKEHLR